MLDNDVRLHNSVHAINDDDERAEPEMVKNIKLNAVITGIFYHLHFTTQTFNSISQQGTVAVT